jgi:Rieske Fe-S protein
MKPVDGLGYIGQNPLDADNVYIVSGQSGNGMTYAAIAGILISDLILKKVNPWKTLYNPARISLATLGTYLMDNASVAAQYEDIFLINSGNSENLNRDEGIVFREGFHHVAVYKDEYGNIDKFSASCPHLGGIVHWNKSEKSWDCPCHGSRFDCFGKVMNGPSIIDLTLISSTPAGNLNIKPEEKFYSQEMI